MSTPQPFKDDISLGDLVVSTRLSAQMPTKMENNIRNLTTMNSTVLSLHLSQRTGDLNVAATERGLRETEFNVTSMGRNVFWAFSELAAHYGQIPFGDRIILLLKGIQPIYFAFLAIIAVPGRSSCTNIIRTSRAPLDIDFMFYNFVLLINPPGTLF